MCMSSYQIGTTFSPTAILCLTTNTLIFSGTSHVSSSVSKHQHEGCSAVKTHTHARLCTHLLYTLNTHTQHVHAGTHSLTTPHVHHFFPRYLHSAGLSPQQCNLFLYNKRFPLPLIACRQGAGVLRQADAEEEAEVCWPEVDVVLVFSDVTLPADVTHKHRSGGDPSQSEVVSSWQGEGNSKNGLWRASGN